MKIETRDYAPHVVRTSWKEGRNSIAMVVHFGLHHIKGNRLPYFSVTASGYENGRDSFGGCCHDLILQHFPELADIVAMHLSDIDGAPGHAEANGWHWVTGMIECEEAKYRPTVGSFAKTPTECGTILANHARINEADAWRIAGECNRIGKAEGWKVARELFAKFIDSQRPRWKREADAIVRKYGLGVYGDGYGRCTPAELAARMGAVAA
jgi:hypothetical protein